MGWITATALFLQISVQMGTPILFGTLGGILGEKTGNLNLGVEGIMAVGAIFGYIIGCYTNSLLIGILTAFIGAPFFLYLITRKKQL